MKCCVKCGVKIIPGINGCTNMDVCIKCNGGYLRYPAPIVKDPWEIDREYADYLEGVLIDGGDE